MRADDGIIEDGGFIFFDFFDTPDHQKKHVLVVRRKLFERSFVSNRFNDFVPNHRIKIFVRILQKHLVLVLVKVFQEEKDFVKLQQLVKHLQQDVCFS